MSEQAYNDAAGLESVEASAAENSAVTFDVVEEMKVAANPSTTSDTISDLGLADADTLLPEEPIELAHVSGAHEITVDGTVYLADELPEGDSRDVDGDSTHLRQSDIGKTRNGRTITGQDVLDSFDYYEEHPLKN